MRLVFICIITCLVFWLLLSQWARAETVDLVLLRVDGRNAITEAQALGLFEYVRSRMTEVGINLRLKRVQSIKDYQDKPSTLLTAERDFIQSYFDLRKLGYVRRAKPGRLVHTHVLRPPIRGYLLGYNFRNCLSPHFSMSTAEEFSARGEGRLLHSAVAMTHEIHHALGAKHTPGSLMDAAALALSEPWNLPITEETKEQVKACLL